MKILDISSLDRVTTVKLEYKSNQEFRILLRSDVHHDSVYCRRDLEKKHLDLAKEHNAKIIDLGDIFDAMQGKNDRRGSKSSLRDEYKQSSYLNALLEDFTEFYKPYADNFLMFGYGNHETAIIKHNEFDLLRALVNNLKVYNNSIQLGKYSGYIVFQFSAPAGGNNFKKILYYNHGAGGDAPVTVGLIADSRRRMYVDADILVGGHNHNEWFANRVREQINGKNNIVHRSVVSLNLPSYKDEMRDGSGWAYEVGMPPKPVGAYWLVFRVENGRDLKFWVERVDGY